MGVEGKSQGKALPQQVTDRGRWVLAGVAALLPALLFAAHPVLALFEQNQSELPLSVIWSPLAGEPQPHSRRPRRCSDARASLAHEVAGPIRECCL